MEFPVTQRVRLSDGRVLSCRSYGVKARYSIRNYVPVIFFHGNMNSSKFMPMFDKTENVCKSFAVRLISFDRPGIGDSMSVNQSMSYSKVADIFIEAIDKVVGKGRKVCLLAYSSGGPYALATAVKLGVRAISITLACSDGHYYKMGHPIYSDLSKVTSEDRFKMVEGTVSTLSSSYLKIANITKRAYCFADLEEALRQEYDGILLDSKLETEQWDFSLSEMNAATDVYVWHGLKDTAVPVRYAKEIVKDLRNNGCNVVTHWKENESHSMIRRVLPELLEEASRSYQLKVKLSKSSL